MHKDELKKDEIVAFFKTQVLMKELSDEQLAMIASHAEVIEYSPGSVVFYEKETSTDLYFIYAGEVDLVKKEDEGKYELLIARLFTGEPFGEMAFIDLAPRSVSVKTTKDLKVIKIPRETLAASPLPLLRDAFNKITVNVTKVTLDRLRRSNENFTRSLRQEMNKILTKSEFGKWALIMTFWTSALLFILTLLGFKGYIYPFPEMSKVIYVIATLLPVALLMHLHSYPLSRFGLTSKNLTARMMGLSFIYALILCFILLAAEFIYKRIVISMGLPPVLTWERSFEISWATLLPFLGLYLIYGFLTEFIARGVIQSSLQKFYETSGSTLLPIFLTASLFGVFNLAFGIFAGLLTFIIYVFLGYQYRSQGHILGVSLVHFFVGITLAFAGWFYLV